MGALCSKKRWALFPRFQDKPLSRQSHVAHISPSVVYRPRNRHAGLIGGCNSPSDWIRSELGGFSLSINQLRQSGASTQKVTGCEKAFCVQGQHELST